jgi:IS5 family transposase
LKSESEAIMHRASGQRGFAEVMVVGGGNARLERIAALLDWGPLEAALSTVYASSTGRPAFPPIAMFKVLLLQHWYGIGDPEMEETLGDRLSFRQFVGIGLGERVPDHSTISRFRSELARQDLGSKLFAAVADQLAQRGYVLKIGTLIDATLIDAAAAEPPKQKGGGRSAADPDATWTKRPNGSAHFGYKLHVAVDQGSTIVRAARLTPANVNEVVIGHELVQGDERAVWADKGYVGPALRERLAQSGIKNRVQRKASRVRRLTSREIRRNVLIARVRARIEGVFGTLKRSYGLQRMRYMGLARNTLAVLVALMGWNLARAEARK